MEEFTEFLREFKEDLLILSNDIHRIVKNKEQEEKDPKSEKIGLKTMQDVTTFYHSEKDLKRAKDNPEIDFVERAINKAANKHL